MPVPDYQAPVLPVLRLFAEGKTSVAGCIPDLRLEFAITKEDAAELLPSGRMNRLSSRAHWARAYLRKTGLLTSPKRGVHDVAISTRSTCFIKSLDENYSSDI